MKKEKLKKILATSAMGIMALAMPLMLTGCDKGADINVRVNGDYIQWQVDGDSSWTNLLSVEEVKNMLGESYKGDTGEQGLQGNPGINGREVEFRKTETYIQWRYVDNNQGEDDNWEDLISLSSLKGDTGESGSNGINGETPFIGTNGNWWIGETDTGVKAEGQAGHTPTIEISNDGYWIIDGVKQSVKAEGEEGNPGVDGREVEFRITETHIQWRYVDNTQAEDDNWENLVSFEDIQKPVENPNQESINQEGFELFSSMMSELFSFKSEYKISYYFRNHSETENYFQGNGVDYDVVSDNPSGLYTWSCVTTNTGELYVDEEGIIRQVYKLNIVGNPAGDDKFVPTKKIYAEYAVINNHEWVSDYIILDAKFSSFSGEQSPGYNGQYLREFNNYELLEDCQTNGESKYILTFGFDSSICGGSNYLFNENFCYKFYISEDKGIEKCLVFERDYLDNSKIGEDVFCSISFDRDKADFTSDIYEELLDYIEEKNGEFEDHSFSKLFGYTVESVNE